MTSIPPASSVAPLAVPAEFSYMVSCRKDYDNHWLKYVDCKSDGEYWEMHNMNPLFFKGPHTFFGIDCFISDSDPRGKSHFSRQFFFRSKEDVNALRTFVRDEEIKRERAAGTSIHRLTRSGQFYPDGSLPPFAEKNYIGHRDKIDLVLADITAWRTNRATLSELGERHSLNYLMVGPPGVGKTTMINVIATRLGTPVFIVNQQNLEKMSSLSPVMNDATALRILAFEDLDRYLARAGTETVADLLNTLDGLGQHVPVVRFFTGNDCKVIYNNKALMSRMSNVFVFDRPSREDFRAKLELFMAAIHCTECVDPFLDVLPKDLCMRRFSCYVTRHVFKKEPIRAMIQHVDTL